MANQEHLQHLRQGATPWNTWRATQPPGFRPDLSGAHLREADLSGAHLWGAHLNRADLSGAHLSGAYLSGAHLSGAYLSRADLNGVHLWGADLNRAHLSGAHLWGAYLSRAHLSGADLSLADLSGAHLSGADLSLADLSLADLSRARLSGARLNGAIVCGTLFCNLDLRDVQGLDTLQHKGPSTIGTDTLERCQGNLPESFLQGAGLSDSFITYASSLAARPIEYYACFITYASRDQDFAQRLYADLQSKGVRCWFAPEDLKIGDRFRQRIDESIRLYDKLLLVLSQYSVSSPWVEEEMEVAVEKEHQQQKLVLFPIRLDEAVMQAPQAWAASIRRTRYIGDFCGWKDHDRYRESLTRLLRDLQQSATPQGEKKPVQQ